MSDLIHVTEAEFENEILSNQLPVVVDFWADWCAPCHQVAPVLEELAERYAGRAVVSKVNVDEEPVLAQKYQIRSIPTVLFMRDGKVLDRLSGAHARESFAERFDALVESA